MQPLTELLNDDDVEMLGLAQGESPAIMVRLCPTCGEAMTRINDDHKSRWECLNFDEVDGQPVCDVIEIWFNVRGDAYYFKRAAIREGRIDA